jgi:S-DNA-T family DNA segregation ATPase FtsK/SpoIIIE
MRSRFAIMEKDGVRSIDQYQQPWARLVIFIDELANLMLSGRKLERHVITLASMGRAAGVHLILSTQRPSADVITGLIRANVPTRVCLPVVTATESRIILDAVGGEQLTAPGSMLIRLPGQRELVRAKARYLTDQQIDGVANAWRAAG